MFIDTHAHLTYPNYADDLDDVLLRAKQAGVDYMIAPATDLASAAAVIELTKTYDQVYGAVGVHPHDSSEWDSSLLATLKAMIDESPKIVAVGEIGLDYYYDYSPREKQIEAFRDQLELAVELDLPAIVHNRESDEDVMKIVAEYCKRGLRCQMHCFSMGEKELRELIEMGQFVSFTGNVTFPKAQNVRELARKVPLERLLIETDSPFLTPAPNRGKRNEPAYARHIAETLAGLQEVTIEDFAKTTSHNAFRLFGVGEEPSAVNTYQIRDSLYVNVTNRCDAHCSFCTRRENPKAHGHYLRMTRSQEPTPATYLEEIGDPTRYNEIVFCGYGEPTLRWDAVTETARGVKQKGGTTRLNTNGHGNAINKRDITEDMPGAIDAVSISLNTADPDQYAEMMRVERRMFDEMVAFAKKTIERGIKTSMTVVQIDEVDAERARRFAEELGAEFRERPYY